MKLVILLGMLIASTTVFAKMDQSQNPSNLKCKIVQSIGSKVIKNVTLSTEEQPAHVINEDVGNNHVFSVLLSGDDYPQTSWVKLLSFSPSQQGEVFSVETETYNMCDTSEINGTVLAEDIKVTYTCKVVCTPRK